MFNSRDELQAAAMHKLAEHINTPAVATTWQDALRLFSSRSWDLFSRYPEAPTVIMTKPEAIIDALARFRGLIDRLVRLDIPGGFPCASFAVDFIGDITITTFIQMRSFTTINDAGQTPLDRYTTSADDNDDVFGMKDMSGTGFLESKVEFIIAGIENGIGPGNSTASAN
jgi:transcriptional regulator, TetR family